MENTNLPQKPKTLYIESGEEEQNDATVPCVHYNLRLRKSAFNHYLKYLFLVSLMSVKQTIPYSCGTFFITFTCQKWLPAAIHLFNKKQIIYIATHAKRNEIYAHNLKNTCTVPQNFI